MIKAISVSIVFCFLFFLTGISNAQVLTLKDAINTALTNYGTIKAKGDYLNATKQSLAQSKRDYLPNVVVSAQQDYGTVNGQNGPLYGFNGLGVASAGPPLAEQNWNAAFGALYLANINWEFFSFGKSMEKIKVVQQAVHRDEDDLEQEKFQHEIKVAAAYLNLIAAQSLTRSQQKNLDRALTIKNTTVARAKNGLIAGVDSSLANAEVSSARIALTKAKDVEQEQSSKLAVLMGVAPTDFVLDTTFISKIPAAILAVVSANEKDHPVLKYYQSRIDLSNEQIKFYRRAYFPVFSLFGVMQDRASGFPASYSVNQNDFSKDYSTGINPSRGNYLLGIGVNWNLTSIYRNNAQVNSQKFISLGLQDEYVLVEQQVKAQLILSDQKIKNALDNYNEAPVQIKAASDAYFQKNAMYKNGLTNIVDLTQTLYALNRAETDRDIAYSNVWQALLLKAAAAGDVKIFTNEF